MKRALIIATSAACLGFGFFVAHSSEGEMPSTLRADVLSRMQQAQVPGLAMAKIENGRVAWSEAFGQQAPNKPLAVDTVFNAASLTKPVFAVTALHLIADDRLALDASLEDHWVDPDVAGDPRHEQLTPRILLSHQSGFPNWRGNGGLGFMFAPGARHEYSGEGYEYLRRAIERKTGNDIGSHASANVFEPAGMKRTTMGWSDAIGKNVARGFNEASEPIDTNLENRGPNAAAHLMTTAADYARFLAWVADGADLPPELFNEMRTPQALHDNPAERFGLGWKLIPVGDEEALMHDGREPGVRTYAVVLPEAEEGLVILTSSSNGELMYRPLIKAALANGESILRGTDQLVWQYLAQLPPQALVPMSKGIARSPSYLSTLLHAVDTALVQTSSLSAADKLAASNAVDPYVFALLHGDIEPAQAEKLIEQLLVKEGDDLRLIKQFDAQAADAWLNALLDI